MSGAQQHRLPFLLFACGVTSGESSGLVGLFSKKWDFFSSFSRLSWLCLRGKNEKNKRLRVKESNAARNSLEAFINYSRMLFRRHSSNRKFGINVYRDKLIIVVEGKSTPNRIVQGQPMKAEQH